MRFTPSLLLFLLATPAAFAGLKRAGDTKTYPCKTEIPAECHKLMKAGDPKKLAELLKEEKFDYEAFSLYTSQMRSACQAYMANPEQTGRVLTDFKSSSQNASQHYSSLYQRMKLIDEASLKIRDSARQKKEPACEKAIRKHSACRTDAFWEMRVTMQNGTTCMPAVGADGRKTSDLTPIEMSKPVNSGARIKAGDMFEAAGIKAVETKKRGSIPVPTPQQENIKSPTAP